MTDQPTNNPPAAPSGPQEDYRVTVARKALAESANAQAPDTDDGRSAAYWWGRLESTAINLLAVIDEGKAAAPTGDLEALSEDELADRLDAAIRVMRPLVDEFQRRKVEQS